MNKKLFTQIKNEWRSNLWLVTELLLVSVVLWYIYRAQNETYMCRSAENVVKSLCFNKLCAVG